MKSFAWFSPACAIAAALGIAACTSDSKPEQDAGPLSPASDAGQTADVSQPAADASDATTETTSASDAPAETAAATDAPLETAPATDAEADAPALADAQPEAGTQPALAKSNIARDTSPNVSDGDKTALSDGMSAFAFDFFGEVNDASAQAKNLVFSPASISLALGMTYAGAAGNTAAQLKSVLHVTQDAPAYFKSLDWLTLALGGRAQEALAAMMSPSGPAQDPAEFRMNLVSSLWAQEGLVVETPFLDTMAADFGAGVFLADFGGQPDLERIRINSWVTEQTLGKINDLLPPGSIDETSRLVLVNALHLKLPWQTPFATSDTAQAAFTLAGGAMVDVPLMHRDINAPYAEDAAAQAVAVPLAGRSIYLVLLVPKAGMTLAQLESATLATEVETLTAAAFASSAYLSLALPRFKFTIPSMSIAGPLTSLGLVDAVSDNADFSGMSKAHLAFDDVFHEAMVGVKETGLEAAAATAIVMNPPSLPPPITATVTADHPFFFGIYDKPTATWLFLGHVVDPSQGDPP
jgi:serine protease inhibitor